MLKNTSIKAYYAESAAADLPRITVSNNTGIRSADSKKAYVGQYYLPTGYTFVEAGLLTHLTNTAMIDIATSGVARRKATRFTADTKEFLMSIPNASVGCVRGYLIVKNPSNVLVTVYSESAFNILNGGFETDTLYGWNAYNIWKNESGMMAYQDARVVNNTYFGSNPYGREGSYNLGVVWDNAAWEQSAERMGHLRSSDFVLGGSGWVSFKIGGGRSNAFAYVSIRKTSDHTEVARFGNKNYNNTTIATTQYGSSITNAEAYLFQYYFDLSSVGTVGESYYFVMSDTSALEWAILTADAFVSYIPVAPSTNSDTLATNILPSISGIDTASNQVPNGNNFVSGLTGWTNVNSVFQYAERDGRGHGAWSNTGSGIGLLRSSAFSINGTLQYLRFDFAGGRAYDKQIYISIKEVGTNIEVIRAVRRDNQASNNTEWHNHLVNLSGLSTSKLYYIELSDNGGDSMGIRNLRLITATEYNGITADDRAVIISGIVTNYTYTKPSALS
jgi:hypothetical protein